jgi:hypothetical protein
MHAELFCTCRSVAVDKKTGYIDVRGFYSSLTIKSIESYLDHMLIFTRIRFDQDEHGRHQLEITIRDGRGNLCGPPIDKEIQVRADPGHSLAWTSTFELPEFRFASPDLFHLLLRVDGQDLSTWIVSVVKSDDQHSDSANP